MFVDITMVESILKIKIDFQKELLTVIQTSLNMFNNCYFIRFFIKIVWKIVNIIVLIEDY